MQIELINQVAGPPLSALGSNLTLRLKVTDSLTREWTKVRISQEVQNEKLRYKVLLDDVEELNVVNSKPVEFENVKVYASNPWYQAQPGFVKNLSVNVIKD